jgi:hypothetical protein
MELARFRELHILDLNSRQATLPELLEKLKDGSSKKKLGQFACIVFLAKHNLAVLK